MTAYVSKEELGLMLPGTMNHYFSDDPEYVVRPAPGPGLFAKIRAWLAGRFARAVSIDEIAGLSDAQLADIGIARADATRAFDASFAAHYNRDRLISRIQTGRICVY